MTHSCRHLTLVALICIAGEWPGGRTCAQEQPRVEVQGAVSDWVGHPDSVSRGQFIKLKVTNLSLLDKASHGKIILYLDAMPLRGLYPVSRDSVADTLGFQFRRTEESQATWDVIQKFGRSAHGYRVSVGPEDGYPVASSAELTFVFYRTAQLRIVIALLVILLIALIVLGVKSDILRDVGSSSPSGRKSYSLGRCQMAWWFFVVFSAFTLVVLVTGELPSIPNSVLILLGIAGGTGLGAVAIDANKHSQAASKISALRVQVASLVDQGARLQKSLAARPAATIAADLQAEIAKAKSALTQSQSELDSLVQSSQPFVSEGFLMDILSDANGISFHRFQIFAWTVLLGIIFFLSALRMLTLVEFDSTLLTLMGISSGTYLGFKFPEK